MASYSEYEHLIVVVEGGVARLTLNRPDVYNAANDRLHWELGQIWLDLGRDPDVRVAVVTGAGRAFSAGGDLADIEGRTRMNMGKAAEEMLRTMGEASALVYNMINLDKPVVSAINGTAVGAGLAVALMADISIAAEDARITDGHTRLGVAAGDHAAMIWPLLCGMARAKRYLLTSDFIDGREAERIGLVSMAVPADKLMDTAMDYARRLSAGPQAAIRFTKRALNQWLRLGGLASFDYSLALETLNFFQDDVKEGLEALKEKREASFPSAG